MVGLLNQLMMIFTYQLKVILNHQLKKKFSFYHFKLIIMWFNYQLVASIFVDFVKHNFKDILI